MSDLKLRLDYGQTGQQDLGVYFPISLPTTYLMISIPVIRSEAMTSS